MEPITSSLLRAKYLAFFAERGHVEIPAASLVPTHDPSVLFTTAGMHPLVPNLLGEPHPAGRRLANVQKCIRTGDIDEVGDDTHLVSFEMLGNWSLGDYYKDDAIRWSFELLTGDRGLALPLARLGVTCFAGDDHVPIDRESAAIWESLGIATARIQFLGRDGNWWGPAGQTGPCGPDTEIFYWVDPSPPPRQLDVADKRWVEIWNNVFMGYTKAADGEIVALPRVNVDTGMGLERTLVAINGLRSVYDVDTVKPLYDLVRGLASAANEREIRIITDHVRAACFMIADGVAPTGKDRGYVLRRLLRRCIFAAQQLGMAPDWYRRATSCVTAMLGDAYPELRDSDGIAGLIEDEVAKFETTLAHGLRLVAKRPVLDGRTAFDLFQTYGFPFELTRELAERQGKHVDEAEFRAELERHRELSRSAAGGTFASGLADHSAEVVRYHTLTHLLQAALREVLGEHVTQRGSNLTKDRLRFDFSHREKIAREDLARVEGMVNGWLARDLVVERATMREAEARAIGAIGAFGEKYGELVSVYSVVDRGSGEVISREFCGGPHVEALADLRGRLRIVKEEGIAAGIRRIKAVLEQ